MRTLYLFLLLIAPLLNSSAQVIKNVPADYPNIQSAINAAVAGDTILVDTGIYFENINYDGKNIVIGSLYLTTGDTSYISQTIIDGKDNGSVVTFDNGEDSTANLCGFTITNGSGGCGCGASCYCNGGGITCHNSSPTLSNLIIIGNNSYYGGGILLSNSRPKLVGITVTENTAEYGGGIFFDYYGGRGIIGNSIPNFDTINRCNIFLNTAAFGGDLYKTTAEAITVILDTFTVINPTDYHAYPNDRFIFDIRNAKIEQVNSDLYVDPNGDNENSGLSPENALRTISFALKKIFVDSLNPNTIYIADGIYNISSGEHYPLGLINNVSLHGQSEENVIFEYDGWEFIKYENNINASIENLTIKGNGTARGIFISGASPYLKNITMDGAMLWLTGSNPFVKNVKISGNTGEAGILMYGSSPTLMNVTLNNNNGWLCGGIRIEENSDPILINVTISENTGGAMGGLHCNAGSDPILVNSIIWNNSSPEIELRSFDYDNCSITFSHSDVKGGAAGINLVNYGSGISKINWLEGNLNVDPLFMNAFNDDLHLKEGSPCIDVGIQDTIIIYNNNQDTLVVPPLVYFGSAPDMGSFEYDPSVNVEGTDSILSRFMLLQNFPNPFNTSCEIKYSIPKSSQLTLKIFNTLGEELETLVNEEKPVGTYEVNWNAANLPSGVYFYRLQAGDFIQTRKMILLK